MACANRDEMVEVIVEAEADAVLIDGVVDQLLASLSPLTPEDHRLLSAVQTAAQRVQRTLRELVERS